MRASGERLLRDDLPRFHALSSHQKAPFWDLPSQWTNSRFISIVCQVLDGHIEHLGALGPELLPSLAKALLLDLLEVKARESSSDARLYLNFIQIYLGVALVQSGNMWGRLQVSHDWIIHSLLDEVPYGPEGEFQNIRLAEIVAHRQKLEIDAVGVVLEWLSGFYYYSRRRAAFRENGHELFTFSADLAASSFAAGHYIPAVECACNTLNWCVFNQRPQGEAERLAKLLEDLYFKKSVPRSQRKQIGILLSTMAGQFSGKEPRAWAELTLAEYRDLLVGHEEVQLLVTCCGGLEEAERRMAEILESLRRLSSEFRGIDPSKVGRRYGRERLLDVIVPLLVWLAEVGRCDLLLEVLTEWYDIPEPRLRSGAFLCFPTYGHGILYAVEGRVEIERRDPEASLRTVTESANRFLGTYVTLSHDPDLPVTPPERPGVPDERLGRAFEDALRRHFSLERLTPQIEEMLASARLVVSVPGQPHPLQSLLCKTLGRTLPMAGSLQSPRPDRTLRRILFWPGGVFTEQFELEAVSESLATHDIAVEVVDPESLNREQFLALYGSPDFDAIWITSHGIYNHWDPHTAFLQLNHEGDQRLRLEELVEAEVPGADRRLLVLNVCDGGTAATLGGVLGIGIGSMVAASNQAVISHIWPVDQRVSPAFGALLAIGLTSQPEFFAAFEYAVKTIAGGQAAILAELRQNLAPTSSLIERVERRSLDGENIMFWGSPIFYE